MNSMPDAFKSPLSLWVREQTVAARRLISTVADLYHTVYIYCVRLLF
jgi:hypothetical protein